MGLTPRYLTKQGRQELADARVIVDKLEDRHNPLSDRQTRELAEARGMLRREFVKSGALAVALVGAGGVAGYKAATYESPEHLRAKMIFDAAESLKQRGLADVEWHHLEGHEGMLPSNPMLILSDMHELYGGGVEGERHLRAIHKQYLILQHLVDAGLREFYFEAVQHPRPAPNMRMTGYPITPEELRHRYERYGRFAGDYQYLIGQGSTGNLIKMFTSSVPSYVHCVGAEDPKLCGALGVLLEKSKSFDPEVYRFWHALDGSKERSVDADGRLIVDENVFDARHILRQLALVIENYRQLDAIGEKREEFASLLPADVMVFGASHMKGFAQKLPRSKRSAGIIWSPECRNLFAVEKNRELARKGIADWLAAEIGKLH